MANNKKRHPLKISILMGGGTFLVSILIFIASEIILRSVAFLLGWMLLVLIISIGILFDIVGVAVAAADEASLNSKAAKKIFGAKEAVLLKKNADKVAAFCNDVVGDICGTLSGAIGTALVFQLVFLYPTINKLLLSSVMAGIIAALTVGGKAFAKGYAIDSSDYIIFQVGRILKRFKTLRIKIHLLGR